MTTESKLKDARAEYARASKVLKRADSSLEALVQARKRLSAVIDRLAPAAGQPTPAEKKLIAVLIADRKKFTRRISTARKVRKAQETKLRKLRRRIAHLKHRLGGALHDMEDSITPSALSKLVYAIAGYTGGYWPTWNDIKDWPNEEKVSIAIRSGDPGAYKDCEVGDLTIDQAATIAAAETKQGNIVGLYCSVSQVMPLKAACIAKGAVLKLIRWWSAHYLDPVEKHICGPACGFGLDFEVDGTQYTDHDGSRNVDLSVCKPSFFDAKG